MNFNKFVQQTERGDEKEGGRALELGINGAARSEPSAPIANLKGLDRSLASESILGSDALS
jgi:hypothetical protein